MNQKTYTVGQINNYIKNIVSSDPLLRNVAIKGEVSNCKYHSMGHIYFSIKDETGSMSCVMFKGNIQNGLKERLMDGQEVVVKGNIDVYPRDGKYQLYAREIIQSGAGELYIKFEQLKKKLYEEGLFEFDFKKPIPKFPEKVGIVTASTGAAIQDILNISKRRNPYVQLILYPAKVQGEGAALTIIQGIKTLDKMGLDTIIIGRGGGSIEDLWAFNDEELARTIFAAKTPIISGTGHEVDNTIADYVADLRAPTPSAAAELAIPDIMKTVREITAIRNSLDYAMNTKVQKLRLLLTRYEARLKEKSPFNRVMQTEEYLSKLYTRLCHAMELKYVNVKKRYEVDIAKLHGLSPTAKLVNGFGYISKNTEPVTSALDIKTGDNIRITLHDGSIETTVNKVEAQ